MNLGRPKEDNLRNSKGKGWFLLGLDSRVRKQFVNTLRIKIIESLGHRKRFGKMVEISEVEIALYFICMPLLGRTV